jgi:hypothetical protein
MRRKTGKINTIDILDPVKGRSNPKSYPAERKPWLKASDNERMKDLLEDFLGTAGSHRPA